MSRAAEFQNCRVFSANQVLFPQISYSSFVYPGDEEALAMLKKVPGAPSLLTYLQKTFTEGVTFMENNQQMIRANTNSFFSLHALVVRCAEILSCPVPDVYITNSPSMNAYTAGHRHTCLVLHSCLIEAMTADELSFVIGHELGHIKCGHGLYRQLGDLLIQYWDAAASLIPLPGIGLVRVPLLLAFWEWFRRAELTCDRAGLLCVQAAEPAMTALGRLAGKVNGFEDEFNIDSTISQASAHKEVSKIVRVVSILNSSQNTHPYVPDRLKQLREYSQSAEYENILRGKYTRDPLGIHEGGVRIQCECGEDVNIKLHFCPKCGRPVDSESTETIYACKCGNILTADARFCPICGAKQGGAAPPPLPPNFPPPLPPR
jgi:Zn-dependent protease with chaperone function